MKQSDYICIIQKLPLSETKKENIVTGKVMFQFDNDEPNQFMNVVNFGKFTVELQQQEGVDSETQRTMTSIVFTSKEGKQFKIFIQNVEQETNKLKMQRFMGLMPSSEIEKSVMFRGYTERQEIYRIEAGPRGWTIIYPDHSTNYRDVEASTDANYKEAYATLMEHNKGSILTEIEESTPGEI